MFKWHLAWETTESAVAEKFIFSFPDPTRDPKKCQKSKTLERQRPSVGFQQQDTIRTPCFLFLPPSSETDIVMGDMVAAVARCGRFLMRLLSEYAHDAFSVDLF